jgi:hypothetical protein
MNPTAPLHQDARVAVVFFGITRSLRFTLDSINRKVIEPARAMTPHVGLFGHFYDQIAIHNPRSGEAGNLDPEEYRLLNLDQVEREAPGHCLADYPIDQLKAYGDYWKNKFRSFQNLVHQLHSLRRATLLAEQFQPDIVIFARPDLWYHTSTGPYLADLRSADSSQVLVPNWAQWRGLNDRLALARGADAIRAYGHRVERMLDFCAEGRKLHSEQLLKYALTDQVVRMIPLHASRVRSDGRVVVEDFREGLGSGGGNSTLSFEEFMASTVPLVAQG